MIVGAARHDGVVPTIHAAPATTSAPIVIHQPSPYERWLGSQPPVLTAPVYVGRHRGLPSAEGGKPVAPGEMLDA